MPSCLLKWYKGSPIQPSEQINVSKSQKHFLLKLHCPKNEWNIWKNSALRSRGRMLSKISLVFWAIQFEEKYFWDLLTFSRCIFLILRVCMYVYYVPTYTLHVLYTVNIRLKLTYELSKWPYWRPRKNNKSCLSFSQQDVRCEWYIYNQSLDNL